MATTWKIESVRKTKDRKSITLREVVDGVDGKIYTESVHPTEPNTALRQKLKATILKDRTGAGELSVIKTGFGVANFEQFINS